MALLLFLTNEATAAMPNFCSAVLELSICIASICSCFPAEAHTTLSSTMVSTAPRCLPVLFSIRSRYVLCLPFLGHCICRTSPHSSLLLFLGCRCRGHSLFPVMARQVRLPDGVRYFNHPQSLSALASSYLSFWKTNVS